MKNEELGALIAALHRSNQLGYQIMIIGAGLPKIFKMLSDEKTYAERLFMYETVDSLDKEHAIQAIVEPAKNLKKSTGSISTIRAQLINKGLIYSARYKELDFTVPEFDGFI